MKVAIVGLGLMGGSLGLALKKSMPQVYLQGYDRNATHTKEALALGLIDEVVSFEKIKEADVIILAIPVEGVIAALEQLRDISKKTTVIDLGSTKAKIIDHTPLSIRENLVASHPMAGTEKFGPQAALENLYENRTVVLCESHKSGKLHLERAIKIFKALKMYIVYMEDAKEHDLHAAYISHLPHAISFALANTVLKQEDPKSILALAAGGFKDMSRIAKSSPRMWSDVFKQNRENLLQTIDGFEQEIQRAREMIEKEEWEALETWMQSATTLHKIL